MTKHWETFKFYFEVMGGVWREYRRGECSLYDFIICAVPSPVYRIWYKIRHPVRHWRWWRADAWIRKLKPEDWICYHGVHRPRGTMDASTVANCCELIRPDGWCHKQYERTHDDAK